MNIETLEPESSINTEEGIYYSGIAMRAGAFFIDYLIIFLMTPLILILIVFTFSISQELSILSKYPITVYLVISIIYVILFYGLYFVFPLVRWSATLGKKAFGISVVSEIGKKITLKNALIRSLLQPLSTFFFGIGYINVERDPLRQAWHDKKAHTVVIAKNRKYYIWQTILAIIGFLLFVGKTLYGIFF